MSHSSIAEPSAFVITAAEQITTAGSILDLACGSGRHTRFLLDQGHRLTAMDLDLNGVQDLAANPHCTLIRLDLETDAPWPLADGSFDAIVVTNYLHRPLLPRLPGLLAPLGLLIYETFMAGNELYGKPANPDFLLRKDELLEVLSGALEVIIFEQGYSDRPKPAMMQRFCGRRRDRLP